MSIELLLIAVLIAITLVAYMIVMNANGVVRQIFSLLFATIILTGTVLAIVQYINSSKDQVKNADMKRLENEKSLAEERMRSQEEMLKQNQSELKDNQGRLAFAAKLNTFITRGTAFAATMTNIDLHDQSVELDQLMYRASDMVKKTRDLKTEFDAVSAPAAYFPQSMTFIKDACTLLSEAASYYSLYYKSDDAAQEELRERLMRQKARTATDNFQKAGAFTETSLNR